MVAASSSAHHAHTTSDGPTRWVTITTDHIWYSNVASSWTAWRSAAHFNSGDLCGPTFCVPSSSTWIHLYRGFAFEVWWAAYSAGSHGLQLGRTGGWPSPGHITPSERHAPCASSMSCGRPSKHLVSIEVRRQWDHRNQKRNAPWFPLGWHWFQPAHGQDCPNPSRSTSSKFSSSPRTELSWAWGPSHYMGRWPSSAASSHAPRTTSTACAGSHCHAPHDLPTIWPLSQHAEGETEVVMMYRGRDANAHRSDLFDAAAPPTIVITTSTHVLSLRVVPSYRHLGARYTMDIDIQEEIASRIAMAKQAFAEMRKAIFGNHALAADARTKLYESLVLSRLMYGCSVWSDVPTSSLKKLEAMIVKHYRSIYNVGFWNETDIDDEEFLATHQLMPFRIHWARHRLVFLQHIARHGLPVHLDLLIEEFRTGKGWLHEVQHELRWMQNLVDFPFEIPTAAHTWHELWKSLASWQPWKQTVKRACKKHLLQEKLAWEVSVYHDKIVQELKRFGGHLADQEDGDALMAPVHGCSSCSQSFPTLQQLALHAFRRHGIVAQERHYAQSTVCPGCLKDYHTTFRVTQHLRYRRNGCWDRIFGARAPDTPVTIELPTHLSKVKRLPAVRRHYGPIRPTSVQRSRIALRQAIVALRAEGKLECAWWFPSDDEPLVRQANDLLRAALHEWIAMQHPTEIDFQNVMFGALFSLEAEDPQRCRLFIHWIEKHMYDDCPADMDPDVATLLEHAYPAMLEDLPTWQIRARMKILTDRWMNLPPDHPDFDVPPPPEFHRPYDRAHLIPSQYRGLADLETKHRGWHFLQSPQQRPAAPHGCAPLLWAQARRRFSTLDGALPQPVPPWSPRMRLRHFRRHSDPPQYEHPQPSAVEPSAGLCPCWKIAGLASRATMRDMVSGAMPSSTWWRSTRPSPIAYSCWIVGIAPAFDGWIAAAQCGQLLAAQGHLVIGRSDLSLGINCLGASCHALRRGLCIGVAERNTLSSTSRRSSFPPHNDTAMAVWCRGRQAHHALVQQWIASESFGGMWVGWRH